VKIGRAAFVCNPIQIQLGASDPAFNVDTVRLRNVCIIVSCSISRNIVLPGMTWNDTQANPKPNSNVTRSQTSNKFFHGPRATFLSKFVENWVK